MKKPVAQSGTRTAARIGVQLGRQEPARLLTVDAIAEDAVRLAELGRQARRALERQRCPQKMIKDAKAIAERYGARVVDRLDLDGTVLGLRFAPGLYVAGSHNLFVVA